MHDYDNRIGVEDPLSGDTGTIGGLEWTHIPGHPRGSVVFRRDAVLITGDHLAGSVGSPKLRAFRGACWFDWDEQIWSISKMAGWGISHILPGHGAPWHGSPADYQDRMGELIEWMYAVA